MADLHSAVQIAPGVLFSELEREAVLLNVTTGKYFGLNEVGTRVWVLLAQHKQLAPVHHALVAEYAVSADQAQRDLVKLVDELTAQGLVSISRAAGNDLPAGSFNGDKHL
jgi:hypothetical protein